MANLHIPLTAPLWIDCLPASPTGPVSVAVTCGGLVRVEFCEKGVLENELKAFPRPGPPAPHCLAQALAQIEEYLNGRRRKFDLPIDWRVMPGFQARSLHLLQAIPYGQIRTYGEVARVIWANRGRRLPWEAPTPLTRSRWCCPATAWWAAMDGCTATAAREG